MLRSLLVAAALATVALPVRADRIAPIAKPAERALRAPVVVIGKVTSIEKDAVEALSYPGAPNKLTYKIAVVKVETALSGADGFTHIKVGFPTSGRYDNKLVQDQEGMFFLAKHHEAPFHVVPYMTPPVDASAPNYKEEVAGVKTILRVVADPAKALKAEKADDRFNAALAIVYKLRVLPEGTYKGAENVALTADESRPILRALADGKWIAARAGDTGLNGYTSFAMLGLTEADGWKAPAAEAGKDFIELNREAFAKWLDGPGKDYRIKKFVAKK